MFDFKEIYEAANLHDAIDYLTAHPESWIIAGGTDTVIKMREGHFRDQSFLSIHNLNQLAGITIDGDGTIHIGPNTTFRQMADSPLLQEHVPALIEATETIGGPQIRNIATIGGNISNGFTTADAPPMLFVMDAQVQVQGPNGKRLMPIADYYVASEVMDLQPGELLTDIIIPSSGYRDHHCHYIKYAVRKSLDIVLLGCAVACKVSKDQQTLEDVRISLGAAGPVPLRALETESKLRGAPISSQIPEIINAHIEHDVKLRTDMRATKAFRLHLCKTLTKRAIAKIMHDLGIQPGF